MSAPPAIVAEHISKRFRVYRERPNSLKERVTKLSRDRYEDFWALRDVSVTVPKGAFYGLVGHNGSGKSSLLRIMAGIHRPTEGTVRTEGRISALLELGAGFHPDLSGKENIYLNAAILGLSKRETDRLYAQIVEFSGLSAFIDTPVKHYSSGMYVRLGFSVAVHVDPQILLVDEVIAVGDEEFQRRCFEHLSTLRRRGATIVLVTHSLNFVRDLCDEATWLDHGEAKAQGPSNEVAREYLSQVNRDEAARLEAERSEQQRADADETGQVANAAAADTARLVASVDRVELLDGEGNPVPVATTLEPLTVRIHWTAHEPIESPLLSFVVWTEGGVPIANAGIRPDHDRNDVYEGQGHGDYLMPRLPLAPGVYRLTAAIHDSRAMEVYHRVDDAAVLHVQPGEQVVHGIVDLLGSWAPIEGATVDRPAAGAAADPPRSGAP